MLKLLIITALATCCALNCSGQQVEISAGVNSGFFNYTGKSATSAPIYYPGIPTLTQQIGNVYSRGWSAIYGLNVQVQQVFASNFIAGLQLGYDVSRNSVSINNYQNFLSGDTVLKSIKQDYSTQPTSGKSIITNQFINLDPFLGYRFKIKKLQVDVVGGIDVSTAVKSKEYINIENPREERSSSLVAAYRNDYRFKSGFVLHCKHYEILVSYAHGIKNNLKGSTGAAYSQLIRFGLSYLIK